MSSSPYTPVDSGRGQLDYSYYEDEAGYGLVTFAGVMLLIVGVLNSLYGIAAIDDANVFVNDARYVFGDLSTWGWFLVALGVLQLFAAFAIWRGIELGAVVRRRLRKRQRDPADALDPRVSGARDDDPCTRHHGHLRAAGLRRPPQGRAGGARAHRGRRGALISRGAGRRAAGAPTGNVLMEASVLGGRGDPLAGRVPRARPCGTAVGLRGTRSPS